LAIAIEFQIVILSIRSPHVISIQLLARHGSALVTLRPALYHDPIRFNAQFRLQGVRRRLKRKVFMSIDKSLRRKNQLVRTRNVLTRGERIKTLKDEERWQDGRSPFGLPKVRVIKIVIKKAKKKEEEKAEGEAAAEGAAPAAAAPAAGDKKPGDKKPAEKKPAEKKGGDKK
jgi:small basic protein (TIGR04137 family)